MALSDDQLLSLALYLVKQIKKEFEVAHLSKNLMETVNVTQDFDGIHVNIPAQTYNMLKYQTEGVLVHTSNGSYASFLDTVGSEFPLYDKDGNYKFKAKPHNHIGYIERVILAAIREWMSAENIVDADTRII